MDAAEILFLVEILKGVPKVLERRRRGLLNLKEIGAERGRVIFPVLDFNP